MECREWIEILKVFGFDENACMQMKVVENPGKMII
jgi:hypothetical protein